ncbi:MAG: hypothetical protein Q9227_002176 [Pyrenula ochraceoflavens]
MSASLCSSCLARLALSDSRSIISTRRHLLLSSNKTYDRQGILSTRGFHASRSSHANPRKSQSVQNTKNLREATAAKIKKKARVIPDLPRPGQRREERRRIVLSNTNAIADPHVARLSGAKLTNDDAVGKVLGFDDPTIDRLRAVEAFKRTQDWGYFQKPATLIRQETVELSSLIREISLVGEAKIHRRIYTGARGAGKSVMLVQAQALAFMNNWIVISIPEGDLSFQIWAPLADYLKAQDFILNQSSYSPLANTTPQAYTQPALLSALLQRTLKANAKVLSRLTLTLDHTQFPIPLQSNLSLDRLCELGANDKALAFHVWRAFWREITNPKVISKSQRRPPILMTVDGLNHWMLESKYRDPDYNPIHAHQFQTISLFLSLLFNCPPISAWDPTTRLQNPRAREPPPLPNGGLILSSLTASNGPSIPSFSLLLSQIEAYNRFRSIPRPSPYDKHDPRVLNLSWYATGRQPPGQPTFLAAPATSEDSVELTWQHSSTLKSLSAEIRLETDFWEATHDLPECPPELLNIPGKDLARPEIVELQGLSKAETKALLEYVARNGLMRETVDDALVGEKWTLAGGGIVGEVLKAGLRVRA